MKRDNNLTSTWKKKINRLAELPEVGQRKNNKGYE